MADESGAAGARSSGSKSRGAADGLAWVMSLSEAQSKACTSRYEEGLGHTARRLQAQADFVNKLSACDSPSDLLACNSEFIQKAFTSCIEEGQRAFGALHDFSFVASAKR